MTDETQFAYLAQLHALGDDPIPPVVFEVAGDDEPELVWRNELGGLTFRIGDRFVKWNPRRTGIDLQRERERLDWIGTRHPAPRVLSYGASEDAQWLVTAALPGVCAVGDEWRARRPEAIRAIAQGLRAIHAVRIDDFPAAFTAQSWVGRSPETLGARPPVDVAVLAGRILRSRRSVWTGISAKVTRTSSSPPTASFPTRSGSGTTARCGIWS